MSVISTHNKRIMLIILLFLTGSITLPMNKSAANPIYVSYYYYNGLTMGGIIPSKTNYNISMKNADVKMTIKSNPSKGIHQELFEVSFLGSYKFYNPHETITLTIAAPFYGVDQGFVDSLLVKVNGREIQHNFTEITDNVFFQWNRYLINYYERDFILSNITFEGGTFTSVEYSWNTSNDEFYYVYDVGTGRSWKGNITERVEFRIEGYQPERVIDNSEGTLSQKLQIIENLNSTSYIWFWDNEYIEEDYVGMKFDKTLIRQEQRIRKMKIYSIILATLNAVVIIPFSLISRKKRIVEGRK
ncbi:MAG: hypothetical protein HGN29_02060 [Asgard group archaeon]|nr:hypothetical protein [Asgard group archaeon]